MSTRILTEDVPAGTGFHVFSRTAGGEFLFGEEETEQFRVLMNQLLGFCGLEALAWCCLSNHFHILLSLPDAREAEELREAMSEEALFSRMKIAFSEDYIREVQWRVNHFRSQGNEAAARDIIDRIKRQMFDLPKFMQMLKRRFSAWYNKKHGRRGTLWESRYGCVAVEGTREALTTMATYIDLNPVRAGLVKDPKDYRWCGYAEAVAGVKRARAALLETVREEAGAMVEWKEAIALYRVWLFGRGEEQRDAEGTRVRSGVSRAQVEAVWSAGGKLAGRSCSTVGCAI